MSWSASAFGKPEAVAKKLAADFANITYLVPAEAAVKDAVAAVVASVLSTQSSKFPVRVTASGSLSTSGEEKSHSTGLTVETVYGFVE
jgi:hypothetical protein